MYICALNRDIDELTKQPELFQKWINLVVEYIRDTHGTSVDAIVGPDTRGFVFAVHVALKLNLPYVPIHHAGRFPTADPNDLIRRTYTDRNHEVFTKAFCCLGRNAF